MKPHAKKRMENTVKSGILTLFSFNLREKIQNVEAGLSAEIRFISGESASAKENLMKKNINFKERLGKGDIYCCAIFREEVVSYCWMTSNSAPIGEIGKSIILKNREMYLYDAFTEPEFRGNGLFPRILTAILRRGRQEGYQKAFIFALSSNKSSIMAIRRTGFNSFQSVYFLDIDSTILCRFGKPRNGESSIEGQVTS